MLKKSVEKLLAAGYIFLRKEDGFGNGREIAIKYSDYFGTWKTLETFKTKVARDKRMNELLDDENSKYLFI